MSAPPSPQINCAICGDPVELDGDRYTDENGRVFMSGAIWLVSWLLRTIPPTLITPNSFPS
jgi:hypothetical protein